MWSCGSKPRVPAWVVLEILCPRVSVKLQRCQIGMGGVQPFLWEGSRSEHV